MRKALFLPLLGVLLSSPLYAQNAANPGALIDTSSKYCFEHPSEVSAKCVAGFPLIPPSFASKTPILLSTPPPGGPDAQQIADAYKKKSKKQAHDFVSGLPSTAPVTNMEPESTPRPTSIGGSDSHSISTPTCDSDCQQQHYEQNYAIGAALGSGVSSVVGGLWTRHRINSFCKKNPAGQWNFPDGSVMSCASWKAGKPVREWPVPPDVQAEDQSLAKQAYGLMKDMRSDLADIENAPAGSYPPGAAEQAKLNWQKMRDIYCEDSPAGAMYTGLSGTKQVCPSK